MTSDRPAHPLQRVAVVGGGPAGLIAAEKLSENGVDVTVFERSRSVGRKFLLAGRGGLNITHSEPLESFVARYGADAEWLDPAMRAFSPDDLKAWCEGLGQPTFAGSSGRVFPDAFRATPLLRAWLVRLTALGVRFATRHDWTGWDGSGGLRFTVDEHEESVVVSPDATIFALGGASWPRTGSTGTWQSILQTRCVGIAPLAAANCGVHIAWSDIMRERFGGAPVKNVTVSVGDTTTRGDLVVTDAGLEGGPIYGIGRAIRSIAADGKNVTITVDLLPDLNRNAVVNRLRNRRKGASQSKWLSSAGLTPVAIALIRESTANALPDDPETLADLVKQLPIVADGLAPIDRAISSAGGVLREELDSNFMLRSQPGTFVAGEMLDWEAPTGGYLLQACFSTGVAAAQGALDWLQPS